MSHTQTPPRLPSSPSQRTLMSILTHSFKAKSQAFLSYTDEIVLLKRPLQL